MLTFLICGCAVYPCIDIWRELTSNVPNHFTFDLAYKANAHDPYHSLTAGTKTDAFGTGFKAFIRYYSQDGTTPLQWQNLLSHKPSSWSHNGATVEFDIDKEEYPGAMQPFFKISATGGHDVKFDLGVAVDFNYKSQGRRVKLMKSLNGDAVTMDGGSEKISFQLRKLTLSMLNLDDDYFGDVDTIYMGPTTSDEYPFLQNKVVEETTQDQDITLAFSWQNRVVGARHSMKLGFKVQVGTEFILKPLIRDVSEYFKKDEFSGSAPREYQLKFNVTEYENKEVTVKLINTNNRGEDKPCESFTPKDNVFSKIVTCSGTLSKEPNKDSLKYVAYSYVVSDNNLRSPELFPKTITLDGIRPPSITAYIDKTTISSTDKGIEVHGTLDDEHSVNVYYQFPQLGQSPQFAAKYTTDPNVNQEPFSFTIPIPKNAHLGQSYHLEIWAEDDNGIPSTLNSTAEITFEKAAIPVVKDVYSSLNRIENNTRATLVIYGTGLYSSEQNATVYVKFNNGDEKELTNFTGSDLPVAFAGFMTIDGQDVGDYNFTVYARSVGAPKEDPVSPASTTLIVWDPEAPQKQERIGQFIDTTEKLEESNKALFNLKYQDIDEIPRNMSFMDQGFFCRFKTFNGSYSIADAPAYNFTHNDHKHISQDGFDIQLTIAKEPTTNFTEVKFNVSNSDYFERIFSLSLYVDSDLAGNESQIKSFDRGITVNSHDKYVRYTVFTNDYLDYTAPNYTFLGNNNSMHFFTSSSSTQDKAEAYGFTWDQHRIPGQGYSIFAIAFAGFDKVKTPIRLIDRTQWQDHYNSTERTGKKITFDIDNVEKNDDIYLKIIQNDSSPTETQVDLTNPMNKHQEIDMKFPDNGDIYKIEIYAIDKSPNAALPSNKIKKQILLTDAPHLDVFGAKEYYHDQEKYDVTVLVNDSDATGKIGIYYRYTNLAGNFVGAEIHLTDVQNGENTSISIPFTQIHADRNQRWKIEIYAKDRTAESNHVENEFKLNPKNPPNLYQVGLSKKSARPGENLLGFVVLNDTEFDNIKIYVQVGNKDYENVIMDPVHTVEHNPKPGQQVPIAFFWTVPQETEVGVKEVWFLVRDSEDLASKPMVKTLVIY